MKAATDDAANTDVIVSERSPKKLNLFVPKLGSEFPQPFWIINRELFRRVEVVLCCDEISVELKRMLEKEGFLFEQFANIVNDHARRNHIQNAI